MARYDAYPGVSRLAAAALLLCLISSGGAAEFQCAAENTRVVAEDARDAALACQGAADAIEFLAGEGLGVPAGIRIEIVPSLNDDDSCEAAGFFLAAENRIVVLSLVEFRRFERWLRVPVSDALYRGLVAHEVAHLIAHHNFTIEKPTIQAQEYIAYVTTLATLDPDQRARVLSQFTGDGYETEQQMNTTIYLCDPMRFGVEAYRHFIRRGREAGFFDAILTGRILVH
jgi:hypothetical protein